MTLEARGEDDSNVADTTLTFTSAVIGPLAIVLWKYTFSLGLESYRCRAPSDNEHPALSKYDP
jgi:hypothetical protein